MSAPSARVFYRLVHGDPPTLWDFTSSHARGRVLRHPTAETLRLWDGLSVFETEAQARQQARAFPRLGRYIAALEILMGGPIRFERTTRTEGHYTLWGEAGEILEWVRSVVPV